ncbi:long chain acyl-CoA synthetase 1-like [Iris pallida]|uniref:Long chain acyl-CoA synthetase 1-like n=1 Tax=Iris pallida TaxID=29817 RepID=A0AAX6FRX4_IRIPA|nr:long chain acyl-CoA synthetase 1-like [Iris pallida]
MIFNILYNHKLSWMKSGCSMKNASPLADFLAFRKVKARLGGRIRLIISGGAPLSNDIEEFLRVTTCAFFTQGYGMTETCGLSSIGYPDDMSLVGTVGVASTYTRAAPGRSSRDGLRSAGGAFERRSMRQGEDSVFLDTTKTPS